MKKKISLIAIFLLLLIAFPRKTEAFLGQYSYDINEVSFSENGIAVDGWAVLNNGNDDLMHNISPTYKLRVDGTDSSDKVLTSYTFNNEKEEYSKWKQFYLPDRKPYDYTKAYYGVVNGEAYPTDVLGADRRIAMEKSPDSRFLINTTFRFDMIRTILNDYIVKVPGVTRVYLTLLVSTISRDMRIFGFPALPAQPFRTIAKNVEIPLTLQQSNVREAGLSAFNFVLKNSATKVKVIVNNGYVQGSRYSFLGNSGYRLVKKDNGTIGREPTNPPFTRLHYIPGGVYEIKETLTLTDISESAPYKYYRVGVKLSGSSQVSDGGSTYAYIPAFWVAPNNIDGKPSFFESNACKTNPKCLLTATGIRTNATTQCPTEGSAKCCSLCTDPTTKAAYEGTDYCKNPSKCGPPTTCKTDPKCSLTATGIRTNATTQCPTEGSAKCCSLCTDSTTKAAYEGTDYCKNPSKCGPPTTCKTDPKCSLTATGIRTNVTTRCPTGRPECCSLCTDPTTKAAYEGTDYCKNPSKCGPPTTCKTDPKCLITAPGIRTSVATQCPIGTPNCCSLCTDPTTKTAYENTDYCKNKCDSGNDDPCEDITNQTDKYCCYNPDDIPICNPPVVTVACSDMSDPQEKYCCLNNYKDQDICKLYKKKDTTNKSKKCSTIDEKTVNFKYPTKGWGEKQLENDACKISCQESIRTIFPKAISEVKAGMGFEYPIKIDSDRYCTAEYFNDSWKAKLEAEVVKAKDAYIVATTNINKAYEADKACGNKQPISVANNCDNGSSLTSDGQCKKDIGFSCSARASIDTATQKFSESCSRSGNSCDCSYESSTRDACLARDKITKKCNLYDWILTSGSSSSSACSGSYENGSCYSYWSACTGRSSWNNQSQQCEEIKCSENTGTFFEDAQPAISAYISAANAAKAIYTTSINKIKSLNSARASCDGYTTNVPYKGANKTTISVKTPDNDEPKQDKYSIVEQKAGDDASFTAKNNGGITYPISVCDSTNTFTARDSSFVDGSYPSSGESFAFNYCNFVTKTPTYYDFWNKKTSAEIKYEYSKDYSVMKYTGELKETVDISSSDKAYINDGRYLYTSFYAMSNVYELNNKLKKIGSNINSSNDSIFNLDFNCTYKVDNLIFPPVGDPKNDGNSSNGEYGSVAFRYRQISLTDPFPNNRIPGWNWNLDEHKNLISTIKTDGYKIYSNPNGPLYNITLDPATMQEIRRYNDLHDYGSYNTNDPYKSTFLNLPQIRNNTIERGGI